MSRTAQVRGQFAVNAAMVVLAMALFAAVSVATGRIDAKEGRGWDGSDYNAMVERAWDAGTANTALRPFVVLLNQPMWRLLRGDIVHAFLVMNVLYMAILALALSLLFASYNPDVGARTFFIANMFLCIAVAKGIAYYPVTVDAGALALLTLTTYAIVQDRPWWVLPAGVAAAVTREFSIAVLIFGVCRSLRRREPLWRLTAVYGLPLAVYFGWRAMVTAHFGAGVNAAQLRTAADLADNLQLWRDPLFGAFFVYFALTVFGGISLFLVAAPGPWVRLLRREPEWLAYVGLVLAPAVVGSADIWRYLAFLAPVAAVWFAVAARDHDLPGRRLALAAALTGATVVTQRPLQVMDVSLYFREWFPYYVRLRELPPDTLPELWPAWGWRFLLAAGLLWALAVWPRPSSEPPLVIDAR